jgi:hypothetical protein
VDVSKKKEGSIALEHDLGRLAAFVEHRLDDGERRIVLAHLAECSDCRAVVAGLARELPAAPVRAAAPFWTRPAVWLPLAASLVLVIGAGWLARDRFVPPDAEPAPTTAAPSTPPTPGAAATPPGPAPSRTTPPVPPVEPGDVKRGGDREVAGRRFRLEAGVWIDTAYDPFALLPVVDVRTAADRDALVARLPALQPFLVLGPKLTVVHAGTVYRFDLPR